MKITVVGLGYVGMSNAVLLAQKNEVFAYDVDAERVAMVNSFVSPIVDDLIEKFLINHDLNLTATLDTKLAYEGADYVIVATPTNYDEATNCFDTSSVETVIDIVTQINPEAVIVIKSTIPVGFVDLMRAKFDDCAALPLACLPLNVIGHSCI